MPRYELLTRTERLTADGRQNDNLGGYRAYVGCGALRLLKCSPACHDCTGRRAVKSGSSLSAIIILVGICLLMFATYRLSIAGDVGHPSINSESPITVINGGQRSAVAKPRATDPISTGENALADQLPPVSLAMTTKDDVIKAAEMRLPLSWDVTETLHRRLKDERRDEAWASSTEQNLKSSSHELPSLKALSAESRMYCAATLCEVVITAARSDSLESVNLMANDLQGSDFDQMLSDQGLSLASISMAGGDQNHQGIVMQIKKK